tara:strand:+ start:438 stop:761 length:324 start_codon:yes stop_codon:yes gene_type:complete
MNGLIRIQSTSSLDLYIPVDSIKEISRTGAAQITIITDPVSPDRTGSYNAPSYQLTEGGSGAGASDNSNVQALIDAWDSVLRGQQSIATVNFRFPIDRFSRAMVSWP